MKTNQDKSSQMASGKSNVAGTSGQGGLNNITSKLQEFSSSTMHKVNSLSTTQKVVGGSLLALGAGWITMNSVSPQSLNKIKKQFSSQVDKIKNQSAQSEMSKS